MIVLSPQKKKANLSIQDQGSPVRREVVHKPRRDADTHFEFRDDGTLEGQSKPSTNKGRLQNKGMGLYKDHVLGQGDDEFDTPQGDNKRPLNDVTTQVKNENRQKDFGAHWEMKDESPGPNKMALNNGKKLTENQQKLLKTMDADWSNYEPSPEHQKIKIAGNGMGGRKGTESSWNMFEDEPTQDKKENRGVAQRGNGMGGRKGSEFNWDF